ncbi:hypothetical protein Tco_1017526 [Tanacetum coccineum]|uniref:Uncharacterized protein n=1 Tax=Tanacetum coccineum TaxID=301880 RepID=A0ABQ5FRT5_9ASTR
MADKNVPTPAPTRSDDQILPFASWVPIGKSNYVLDLQKKQKNPICQISVDILQNTNFFRAFTASASLDETRFVLDANLLREALEITPIDQAHQFVSPPSGDTIMDFLNELGYTEVIHFVSRMAVNNLYQPWREILSMINQCLTGKTSGHDRPRFLVLQMLWGIITSTNVDYAELMWKEFVQAIQTFLTDKANLGSPTKKGRKDKPHVIPYCRFTKLIICHLVRIHNIHQRSASPFHLAKEDLRLGNLKFVSKGEVDEVFGMSIPNELILNNIRYAPYYNAYLEMVAKHDQKVASEKEGKKKTASAKQPKPKPSKEKPSKPSTAKPPKPKPAKEKSTKATPLQNVGKGKVEKVHNVKSSFQLVDEPDEEPAQPEPELEHQCEGEEYDVERAIQMSLESFHVEGHAYVGGVAIREHVAEATRPLPVVEGKGKAIVTKEQAAQSLTSAQPQDDTSTNIVRDSSSPVDAETGAESNKTNSGGDTEILQIAEELGEDVDKQVNLEEKTAELDQDQAGSDPGETFESRPLPEQVFIDEDQAGPDPREIGVALAGPDPEPTHDKFMTNLYPKVQESLKFLADEHVILKDPLSSTRTLSSMKNLEDAYTIGDQFINDKSTEDEPGKLNVEAEVVSMVTVPIYQASSSIHLLTTESELATRVAALEKKFSNLEQKNKNLDNTTRNLGSKVFTLELRDLPHKINETVRESVKEAVHVALQALLRDRFRELPEADMKEILHHRMFESGTYKSLPEHVALYEALEASIERAQRDEFLAEKDKSRKRRRDDQDPPPPLPDSDPSKKRRHTFDALGSSQPPAPQSSAGRRLTLEKLLQAPPSNKDIDSAHLPKIKQRPEWLKPIPEEDRPETPELDWIGKKKLRKSDLEGSAYKVAKAFHENNISLQFQMEECHRMLTDQVDLVNPEGHRLVPDVSKPLPLGGPPGDKGRRSALSISKLKAAQYLDFRLEELVLSPWIESERVYDISAVYGISHW